MAIDPLQERLISLKDATKLFPTNGRGKHPHVSAIYRYTTTGCRGVVLESIQTGSVRSTSREAVARFFQRLTALADTPSTADTSAEESIDSDEAGRVLDETLFKKRRGRRQAS